MDAAMSVMCLYVIVTFFFLTVAFQVKHFVADYLLQNEYMLGKFKEQGWVVPLAAHCGVHALMTFALLLMMCSWLSVTSILLLCVLDSVIHFIMDRIKASPNMLGKFQSLSKGDFEEQQRYEDVLHTQIKRANDCTDLEVAEIDLEWATEIWADRKKSNKMFWISLGVDQMIHHLTHDLIVFIVMVLWVLRPVI